MTKIINCDNLDIAAKCLADGGTVAFPTETVYGLGADAMNELAIDKIYKAKGRPSDNPLIIHIAKKDDVNYLAKTVSRNASLLMDKFWPGPLTIIFPKKETVPFRVTGGLDTVAIRCPSDKVARELISKSGKFIAAPSANLSGSPSPTNANHVISDLDGRIDYIITSSDSEIGLESTVIDLTSDIPTILRPGAITLEMIKEVIPSAVYDISLTEPTDKPKCPGMKYKHYSPKAEVEVVCGNKDNIRKYILSRLETNINAGVLTYKGGDYDNAKCVLSAGNTMSEYASSLFYNLRVFDEYKVSVIYAEFIEEDGIGVAVRNRLYKSAGNKITRV